MHQKWLQRDLDASGVIVIFGGWAIGSGVFEHLKTSADVLFISDYRDLDFELPDLDHYETRTLVAWSFGVASYCYWQQRRRDPFTRKVAINGSMAPIDQLCGIAPRTLQKTIDTLSNESFQVFLARSFGEEQPLHSIDISARRAELVAVQQRDYSQTIQVWDKVWISRDDQIFSFKNMQRAWGDQSDVLDAPHVPFDMWTTWKEILE
ncbi:hypothetical protein A9Q96_09655 [Rhodobacterales bacterium 52_120_T64]|nr:hypothetical protein A9Q96_09655 [Rhodobacterales bacterium 52_120_T64]